MKKILRAFITDVLGYGFAVYFALDISRGLLFSAIHKPYTISLEEYQEYQKEEALDQMQQSIDAEEEKSRGLYY